MAETRTADVRRIVIEIKGEKKEPKEKSTELNPEDEKQSIGDLLKNAIFSNTARDVMNGVKQVVLADLNRRYSLSEDYIGERTLNNVLTAVGKTKTLAQYVISGVILSGGNIGGGLVGLGLYGVSEFINNQANLSQYYRQINSNNYQTGYYKERAGLVNGSKGTEN